MSHHPDPLGPKVMNFLDSQWFTDGVSNKERLSSKIVMLLIYDVLAADDPCCWCLQIRGASERDMDDDALYSVIKGQQAFNNSWGRPKLEIPNLEPATPRRRCGQSPRGIYEFPKSPQSPGDSLLYNSSSPLKGSLQARRRLWVQDPMDSTVTAMSPSSPQYNSPFTNHPGHGFGECGADCSRNGAQRLSSLMGYAFGENVLVRCNQTKWLVGQVKECPTPSLPS
jgi:hypothetical protein